MALSYHRITSDDEPNTNFETHFHGALSGYPALNEPGYSQDDKRILVANETYTKSHLLGLPDELLELICQWVSELDIEYANFFLNYEAWESCEHRAENNTNLIFPRPYSKSFRGKFRAYIQWQGMFSLMLTSKRLHRLAIPLLYSRVGFYNFPRDRSPGFVRGQCWLPRESTDLFFETVERNPLLQPLIHHLEIQFACSQRGLKLRESFDICRRPQTLKSLFIQRFICSEDLMSMMEPYQAGTLSLKSLSIYVVLYAAAEYLERLISWPRALEKLYVDSMTMPGSYSILVKSLATQRNHLRVLVLGILDAPAAATFAIAQFPNLESFKIRVEKDLPIAIAVQNWLTPSLKCLSLMIGDYTHSRNPTEAQQRLKPLQVCQAFVKAAAALRTTHNIGLQEMSVVSNNRCPPTGSEVGAKQRSDCLLKKPYDFEEIAEIVQTMRVFEACGFKAFQEPLWTEDKRLSLLDMKEGIDGDRAPWCRSRLPDCVKAGIHLQGRRELQNSKIH